MPRSMLPAIRTLLQPLAWFACAGSCACGEEVMRLGTGEPPTAPMTVDRILLRQAASATLVSELSADSAISLSGLASPDVNLEAVVSGPVGSVEFIFDHDVAVEQVSPFTYPGDTDGKLQAFTAELGPHTVTVAPYSGLGAEGQRGTSLTLAFTFID